MSLFVAPIRRWFRSRPELGDKIRPLLRRLGYATPLQVELRRHLEKVPVAKAVQIGAHDGVTHDSFREYIIRPGWQSIVVEPNPFVFRQLKRNYQKYPSVRPVNAAISHSVSDLTLWAFDEAFLRHREDRVELSTLVSFSRENLMKFVVPGDEALNHLHPFKVKSTTVEELIAGQGWTGFDALFVDVEGYENEILLRLDYARLQARWVVFENHLLPDRGAAIKGLLGQHGFSCRDIDEDTIASRL